MKKGFTLIELLIVMVVLGILVTIATPGATVTQTCSHNPAWGERSVKSLLSCTSYGERNDSYLLFCAHLGEGPEQSCLVTPRVITL